MRRTVFVLSTLAVLMFSVAQLAAAQWKANPVTNQTDESLYVIHSTWRPAKDNIPSGFRTRGHYRLAPGETQKFYAWSENSIYFRILRSGEAIKPNVDKVTFSFWVHPSRSFMMVSDELSAAVKFSDLSYVDRSRDGFVRADGFMKYSNGSVVNITSGWVSVVPDAPDTGDGVGPGVTPPATPPPEPAAAPEGMVLIPAGEFEMGSNDADSYWDRPHIHTVYVDAFYMDTHEVTNADFKRFVLANPQWQKSQIPDNLHDGRYLGHWDDNNYPAGKANHPVVDVSWYAAMAYAKWAGKRLPTEAEWEKAARGGKSGLKYPWGNTISSTHANYNGNVGGTTAVGAYPANGYGLYDMVGNVGEWCLDAYDGTFYLWSRARNPVSDVNTLSNIFLILNNYTQIKMSRVFRGGNCYDTAQDVRVAFRNSYSPPASNSVLGFRCVRSVSPSDAGDGVGTGAIPPPVPSVTPQSPEAAAAPEGMVLIPAGEFQMGSNDADSYPDEQPVHTVYVDAFYMDTHEVTNAEFKRFVLANPQWQRSRIPHNLHDGDYLLGVSSDRWGNIYYPARKANHPVVYVSWYAAVAYAKWAGKRLPTEAEWEKAARGGRSGLKYPWGNTISRTRANYGGYLGGTYTVGRYPANGYGLYDMVGNVWEWCLDEYDKNFYTISPTSNPLSGASSIQWLLDNYAEIKTKRVLRGGSYNDLFSAERKARVAYRFGGTPTGAHYLRGFRCAKSVSP